MATLKSNRLTQTTQASTSSFSMDCLESRQLMSVGIDYPGTPVVESATTPAMHTPVSNKAKTLNIKTRINIHIPVFPLFIEPKTNSAVTGFQDFSKNPLFNNGTPSINDISQGQIGDCYFLASLGSVALHDPSLIEKDITQRADGTYDVFFHKSNGAVVDEHVDGKLPVDAYGDLEYAQLGQGGCTWVAIMEKAFTYFRNPNIAASYATINSGWGSEAFADLGGTVTEVLPGVHDSTTLFNDVAWSMLFNVGTNFGTKGGGSGPLVHGHEYTVVSARVQNGVKQIEVRNPWGYNPNFVANNGVYGASNDGYMWVNASDVLPELNEFVNASV